MTAFSYSWTQTHVHKLEDNLSEAKARLAEAEKSQAEINAIRLQGKFLDSFVQCYFPWVLLYPCISCNSGSPALPPLANLPNPSTFAFLSLKSDWINSSPASLWAFPSAGNSQMSEEHKEDLA